MAKSKTVKANTTKQLSLSDTIIPKGRQLFFCEDTHKYKDEFDSIYTSVTTLIHKYVNEFDISKVADACERIGKNPNHKDYLKYKGKSKKEIIYDWSIINKEACDKGTTKHNFLENIIKSSSGFKSVEAKPNEFVKLYTIDDILKPHKFGKIKLSHASVKNLIAKYPDIYDILETLINQGYKIYSEVCVYDGHSCISGLIDVIAIKDDSFIILDWKTNKSPIMWESGFFKKDVKGNPTDEYTYTNKFLKAPLSHLQDSTGNHYAMQLSTYAYLTESFGLRCKGIVLCHIRTVGSTAEYNTDGVVHTDTDKISMVNIPYLKDDVGLMIGHHNFNNTH